MSSDTRRYRSKATGIVYRIVMQARSPFGPVILRAIEGPGEIYTTNDLLAVDYEFFRMGEDAPDRVAARERSREEISADLTAMTASRDEWRAIAQESIAHHEETARERDYLREDLGRDITTCGAIGGEWSDASMYGGAEFDGDGFDADECELIAFGAEICTRALQDQREGKHDRPRPEFEED